MNFEEEFKEFIKEYEKSGFVSQELLKYPRLIVNENKVLDIQNVKGVSIRTKKIGKKLKVCVNVKKGTKLKMPIHMCFGVLKEKMTQDIDVKLTLEDNVDIKILSHCFFPKSKNVTHIMNGNFVIGKNSRLIYDEEHFHGKKGAKVYPHIRMKLKENSYFKSAFATKQGVIGTLDINYKLNLGKNAAADVFTKVLGRKDDKIIIVEEMNLIGNNSKGLLKSRVAATQKARCIVKSVMKGIGKNTKGHVDCTEIIEDKGMVSAIPIVEVKEKTASITHEASLGRINKKQLETLMSKGLSEEEATEIIINGMLR